MTEYQDELVLWLNGNDKGAYYSLKNESGSDITIKAGEQIYLNPRKAPIATKSRKIESQPTQSEDISGDIPF